MFGPNAARTVTTWSLLAAAIVSLGCAADPSSPRIAPPPLSDLGITEPIRTIRDQWRDIALRHPGFGGVWRDSTGQLTISSSTGAASTEMRQAVTQWLLGYGRPDLASQTASVARVSWDYATLDGFVRLIEPTLVAVRGVNSYWIDETKGRLGVSTDDDAAAAVVSAALPDLHIPVNLVFVEVTGPNRDLSCTGLRSVCSPMMAGLGIVDLYSNFYCTISFVGWRADSVYPNYPDTSYRVATTASHCTATQGYVNGDPFWQPDPVSGRVIGVEIDDAPIYDHATCVAYDHPDYNRCRFADVAVMHVDDTVPVLAGAAAISSAVTPDANPPWARVPGVHRQWRGGRDRGRPCDVDWRVGRRAIRSGYTILCRCTGGEPILPRCLQRMSAARLESRVPG